MLCCSVLRNKSCAAKEINLLFLWRASSLELSSSLQSDRSHSYLVWDFYSSRKVAGWWLHQLHSWHSGNEGGERRVWNNRSGFTAVLWGNLSLSVLDFSFLTHSAERTVPSRVFPVSLFLNLFILQGSCESLRVQASGTLLL